MENYETNEDGSVKLDADGNPIPKSLNQEPETPPQSNIPEWLVAVNAANNDRARALEENRLLKEQLQRNNPAPTFEPLAPGSLHDNPQALEDRIVSRLTAQVAPLNAFMLNFQRQEEYVKLKRRAAMSVPVVASLFARGGEGLVDQEMEGKDPTEQNFLAAVERVLGKIALANPSFFQPQTPTNPNPNPTPPQNNNNNITPPHLRPANPPNLQLVPNNNNSATNPDNWDENTRRLWRESRIVNPEDYYELTHCSPDKTNEVYARIMKKQKGA